MVMVMCGGFDNQPETIRRTSRQTHKQTMKQEYSNELFIPEYNIIHVIQFN